MTQNQRITYARKPITYTLTDVDANHGLCHIRGRGYDPVDYWGDSELNDFAGMEVSERLKFEWEHSAIIGYADNIRLTEEYGLEMDGHVFKDIEAGAKVYPILKNGVPMESSITFEASETEELGAGETAEVNGRTIVGPVRIFRKWKLKSISLCCYGVDDTTEVTAVKMSKGDNPMRKRKWSEAEPQDEEKKVLTEGEEEKKEEELSETPEAEKIAALEEEIAALKSENEELSARLSDLEGTSPVPTEEEEKEKKEELEETEEEKKEELSRLSKRLASLEAKLSKLSANVSCGYTPLDTVNREEYTSPMAYLSALEAARLNQKTKTR